MTNSKQSKFNHLKEQGSEMLLLFSTPVFGVFNVQTTLHKHNLLPNYRSL